MFDLRPTGRSENKDNTQLTLRVSEVEADLQ